MATRSMAQAREAPNQVTPALLVSEPESARPVPEGCSLPEVCEAWQRLEQSIAEYMPGANLDYIRKAYEFAVEAHDGDLRKSGEPYVVHPIEVADILAQMSIDQETIAGA